MGKGLELLHRRTTQMKIVVTMAKKQMEMEMIHQMMMIVSIRQLKNIILNHMKHNNNHNVDLP